ncbi:hypothetical protein WN944_020313 [Citrus x changshan-huyou]|uniref:Uncharacterized protein n=1 Tax=Citrus x changshan-huyou TaxID=2935761 RepID=A0AAP0LXM3_9ROSI
MCQTLQKIIDLLSPQDEVNLSFGFLVLFWPFAWISVDNKALSLELRTPPSINFFFVQHLIERCLLLHMSRDQCIKALAEHAGIRPLVTLTVWRELQKENKDFFRAYFHSISPRPFMSKTSSCFINLI